MTLFKGLARGGLAMGPLGAAVESSTSTSVVVGGSAGIGLAMVKELLHRRRGPVVAASRRPATSSLLMELQHQHPDRLITTPCDVTDAASVRAMADAVRAGSGDGGVDLLLNVAGVLQDEGAGIKPERNLASVDAERMARVLQINAIGPVLVTQALQTQLAKGAVVGSLSARVGSIGDNGLGGWWSYRMSKAALNMATRNMAREFYRKGIIAVALHPGTTATALSAPFQKNVRADKLFTAEFTARALLDVLERVELDDSGGFFAYDGSAIEF